MPQEYIVRTIFLQNYFAPAQDMAQKRREGGSPQDIVSAMKRSEVANQTLESELNAFAEKNLRIISVIPHPSTAEHQDDLLITVILQQVT